MIKKDKKLNPCYVCRMELLLSQHTINRESKHPSVARLSRLTG
jgi:hypothetical protein